MPEFEAGLPRSVLFVQPREPVSNVWLSMERYRSRLQDVLPASISSECVHGSHVNMREPFRSRMKRYDGLDPLPPSWPGPIDLVHITDVYLAVHRNRFKAAQVVTVHDMMPKSFGSWWPPGAAYASAVFVRSLRAATRCDVIVTPSENSRRELLAATGFEPARAFTALVPLPDWVVPAPPEARREPGRILQISSLARYKNIPLLLHALARPELRGARLVRVGKPLSGGYRDLAEALRVTDRIEERGFVSDSDLLGLLHTATVLAQPSFSEGFGMPVAEAMAAGLPVVVSDGGALPEVVGPAGRIVPLRARKPGGPPNIDDARDFARALAEVLEDTALQQSLTNAGLCESTRFRIEAVQPQLLAAYRAAMSRARARTGA